MTELQLWKLFHWQFVLIKILYNQKQPSKTQPKSLSCCDEIMLRDEITGLDGTYYPNTTVMKSGDHRKIRLKESNAKCRHLKKWPEKGLSCSGLSVWGPLPS